MAHCAGGDVLVLVLDQARTICSRAWPSVPVATLQFLNNFSSHFKGAWSLSVKLSCFENVHSWVILGDRRSYMTHTKKLCGYARMLALTMSATAVSFGATSVQVQVSKVECSCIPKI